MIFAQVASNRSAGATFAGTAGPQRLLEILIPFSKGEQQSLGQQSFL